MKFIVILFTVLMSLGAAAQQSASSSTTTVGAVAAIPSLVGFYDGSMVGDARGGLNAFWVAIDHQDGEILNGKANFHYGLPACRGPGSLPFTGTIQNGSVIVIKIEGRVSGCERTIVIQQVDNRQLSGTLTPQDGVRTVPWDIVLTRTQ